MNFDINEIMQNPLLLIPLVTAVVQGIKMVIPEKAFKWCPLISIVVAILLSLLTTSGAEGFTLQSSILSAFVVGLASSGLYSGLKTTMQNGEKTID